MAGWEELKTDAAKVASKVAASTERLVSKTTDRLRLETLKLRLCEEYEKLGRKLYKTVKNLSVPDYADDIEKIDEIKSEIEKLKSEEKDG